jgi:hypothetical protein
MRGSTRAFDKQRFRAPNRRWETTFQLNGAAHPRRILPQEKAAAISAANIPQRIFVVAPFRGRCGDGRLHRAETSGQMKHPGRR